MRDPLQDGQRYDSCVVTPTSLLDLRRRHAMYQSSRTYLWALPRTCPSTTLLPGRLTRIAVLNKDTISSVATCLSVVNLLLHEQPRWFVFVLPVVRTLCHAETWFSVLHCWLVDVYADSLAGARAIFALNLPRACRIARLDSQWDVRAPSNRLIHPQQTATGHPAAR